MQIIFFWDCSICFKSSPFLFSTKTIHNFNLASGVPQGSNLGPLLLVLFLNDLLLKIDCPILGYADDKIFSDGVDEENPQRNLTVLFEWSNTNKLKLNIKKCFVVSYSRSTRPTCFCGSFLLIFSHGEVGVKTT